MGWAVLVSYLTTSASLTDGSLLHLTSCWTWKQNKQDEQTHFLLVNICDIHLDWEQGERIKAFFVDPSTHPKDRRSLFWAGRNFS